MTSIAETSASFANVVTLPHPTAASGFFDRCFSGLVADSLPGGGPPRELVDDGTEDLWWRWYVGCRHYRLSPAGYTEAPERVVYGGSEGGSLAVWARRFANAFPNTRIQLDFVSVAADVAGRVVLDGSRAQPNDLVATWSTREQIARNRLRNGEPPITDIGELLDAVGDGQAKAPDEELRERLEPCLARRQAVDYARQVVDMEVAAGQWGRALESIDVASPDQLDLLRYRDGWVGLAAWVAWFDGAPAGESARLLDILRQAGDDVCDAATARLRQRVAAEPLPVDTLLAPVAALVLGDRPVEPAA